MMWLSRTLVFLITIAPLSNASAITCNQALQKMTLERLGQKPNCEECGLDLISFLQANGPGNTVVVVDFVARGPFYPSTIAEIPAAAQANQVQMLVDLESIRPAPRANFPEDMTILSYGFYGAQNSLIAMVHTLRARLARQLDIANFAILFGGENTQQPIEAADNSAAAPASPPNSITLNDFIVGRAKHTGRSGALSLDAEKPAVLITRRRVPYFVGFLPNFIVETEGLTEIYNLYKQMTGSSTVPSHYKELIRELRSDESAIPRSVKRYSMTDISPADGFNILKTAAESKKPLIITQPRSEGDLEYLILFPVLQ